MSSLELTEVSLMHQVSGGGTQLTLDRIDLLVESGTFVTLIGPSGCGKSSLLMCMGGLQPASGGSIALGGTPMASPEPSKISYVFQDYSLLPWKNIWENASIGLKFAGMGKAERKEKALEALELVQLGSRATQFPAELSGGMQQRVAIARALTMDPEILLLDEPFGALDEQTRRTLGVEMADMLRARGKTIVLVTHSLDEAVFWADQVVVMGAGPGRIIERLTIDRSWPRGVDFMVTEQFAEYRSRLLGLISQPVA